MKLPDVGAVILAHWPAPWAGKLPLTTTSNDGEGDEKTRLFLKRVAIGRGADPGLLLKLLELDAGELDESFRTWLLAESAAARQRFNPT